MSAVTSCGKYAIDWRRQKRLDYSRRKVANWRLSPKGQETKKRNTLGRAANRAKLAEIKLASGCVECGFREHPAALEFDHIPERGPKLFTISQADFRDWDLVMAEIAKCEVVCANHHAIRTAQRHKASHKFYWEGQS